MIWSGVFTAVVTPFSQDGNSIEIDRFKTLVKRQVEAGIDGLIVMGTTGESPTVSRAEGLSLIQAAIESAQGQSKVIAGVGGNNTATVLETVRDYSQITGLDGIMLTCPYYSKPSQAGLFAHYAAVAEATDLPIVIYNIPGRTGVNMAIPTMQALHERFPHLSGVKEASGELEQISETIRAFRGTDFQVLAGDDAMLFSGMTLGGTGVVSVLSNLLPEKVKSITTLIQNGEVEQAARLHLQYLPLMSAIFLGGNPSGIKSLMATQGMLNNVLRLPLVTQGDDEHAQMMAIYDSVMAPDSVNNDPHN